MDSYAAYVMSNSRRTLNLDDQDVYGIFTFRLCAANMLTMFAMDVVTICASCPHSKCNMLDKYSIANAFNVQSVQVERALSLQTRPTADISLPLYNRYFPLILDFCV